MCVCNNPVHLRKITGDLEAEEYLYFYAIIRFKCNSNHRHVYIRSECNVDLTATEMSARAVDISLTIRAVNTGRTF